MSDFVELEIWSNWGYGLQLHGERLRHGEALELRWPDGHIDQVVITEQTETSGGGFPGRETVTFCSYFVTVEHRGMSIKLPLRAGMWMRRVA